MMITIKGVIILDIVKGKEGVFLWLLNGQLIIDSGN